MKNALSRYKEMLGIIITIASVVVWAYSTFFTQKAASAQNREIRSYVDVSRQSQMDLLKDMSLTIHRIDERVYNLAKERK